MIRLLDIHLAARVHIMHDTAGVRRFIDLITTCIDHPAAANQTFLVSDGEDLSTAASVTHSANPPACSPSRKLGSEPPSPYSANAPSPNASAVPCKSTSATPATPSAGHPPSASTQPYAKPPQPTCKPSVNLLYSHDSIRQ